MKHLILALATLSLISGCASDGTNSRTMKGVGIGALAGAAAGTIIGNQGGNRERGAVIGAASGAVIGGLFGRKLDKQAEELSKVAETKRTEDGILTKLKSDILFDSGSSVLKPAAIQTLGEVGDILKKYPENKITVIGHTDNTGSPNLNQRLSEQRAEAVKIQLSARGVPQTAVSTVGMGSSQPVGDNKTAAGRSQNRRVELSITMPEQAAK